MYYYLQIYLYLYIYILTIYLAIEIFAYMVGLDMRHETKPLQNLSFFVGDVGIIRVTF